jgi:hypothetical protein
MVFKSQNAPADMNSFSALEKYLGKRGGKIEFEIGGKVGSAEIEGGRGRAEYVEKNASLDGFPKKLPLPDEMRKTRGNISAKLDGERASFVFQSPEWSFSTDDADAFVLNHKDAKKLLSLFTKRPPLAFLKSNVPVTVAGKYRGGWVSDLNVRIGGMTFVGTAHGGGITLDAAELDMDAVLDDKWFAAFGDNQYLSGDPMLAPFDFGADLVLTANRIKFAGAAYDGFMYALNGGSQKMSVSDSKNGKLLLTVSKSGARYRYLVQMDKFFIPGKMFADSAPVNIEGATVTAQAELESRGVTAADLRRNMTGMVDAAMDGGFLIGLGTDAFYDNANRYEKRDAEPAVARALSGGRTAIKELSVTGEYSGGDFRTLRPFLMTARHTDATGHLSILNNAARIRANVVLRGTNPLPRPIALDISDGRRDYAISDILQNIDLEYLREFIRTRDKF